jgi:hypothetical protein
MVNYKVVNYTADINTPHVQKADVLEIKTNLVIESQIPVGQAKEVCRHLNFGGGFDGNTPSFFLEKLEIINHTQE